jgi:serine/threonine protein kinase
MVLEFCAKGNLKSSILKQPENWTKEKRLHACLDASRALEYLHSQGIIHRDLKTENFFVSDDFTVKLGDFGESRKAPHRRRSSNNQSRQQSTQSTISSFFNRRESSVDSQSDESSRRMTILGTVAYMAPELVNAEKFYTTAIDVYALGVTFWEIWSGKEAYGDCSTFDIYKYVADGIRPELDDSFPNDLKDIIKDSWHQDSSDRPTARALVHRFESLLGLEHENSLPPERRQSDLSVKSVWSSNPHGNFFSVGAFFRPVATSITSMSNSSTTHSSLEISNSSGTSIPRVSSHMNSSTKEDIEGNQTTLDENVMNPMMEVRHHDSASAWTDTESAKELKIS